MDEYLGIKIDLERDKLFDELGIKRLQESYMREDEISPQHRFAFVSKSFGSNPEHAQRLYEYSSQHWLSYSTPILSFGRSKRGMPISCFLNFIEDTAEGLVDNLSETNWLSMLGGGLRVLCHTLKYMMRVLWLIAKVVLAVVLTPPILILVILISFLS